MKGQRAPIGAAVRPATVDVSIGELVLHGFDEPDRRDIADALQRELGRLLAERAGETMLGSGPVVDGIDAGSVTLRPGATARDIGEGIAGAVLRSLTGGPA
jgi:hypothetical protein